MIVYIVPNFIQVFLMNRVRFRYICIFVISLSATLWSLYIEYFGDPVANILAGILFDSSRGIVACTLCRYIRMCMYPLVIISWIALLKKQRNAYLFMQPLMLIGTGFSIRKRLLQHFSFPAPAFCNPAVPCSLPDVNYFGFISLAFLWIGAFMAMYFITLRIRKLLTTPATSQ